MARDSAVAAYIEEARGWDHDRMLAAARSARRAWWVAAAAVMLAVLSLLAVALLVPLKTVEPYLIRVDQSTGMVDVVPRYDGTAPVSEVVTRQLLSQYVSARERFVMALAEADYTQVGAYQTAALNQRWSDAWERTNPSSPLMLYRDGTVLRVQVQSVSFLTRATGEQDLAQLRFLVEVERGGAVVERRHYLSTLTYAYGPPAEDARQRALNPLGLKVLEYRREAEVVAEPVVGDASGAAP